MWTRHGGQLCTDDDEDTDTAFVELVGRVDVGWARTVAGPKSGTMTASSRPTRRAQLLDRAERDGVPLRAILVTIGLVVLVYLAGQLLFRLKGVVLLIAVAGFVALVLDPQVRALQRWGIRRRGAAVGIVAIFAVLLFAGLAFAFGYPLINAIRHFANALPGYVKSAEHGKGWIGGIARRYHVQEWVRRNSPRLISLAQSLSRPALALGKGAFTVVAELVATFALVVILLLEAPKLRSGLLALVSADRAARYADIGTKVSRAITGYVLGDLLTSLIAGTVVFVTLAALGVPYALLFGVWVALVDFLPQIGGALAGIPTVLFAVTHSLTAGIITLVVFLVYTQIENHILNPLVMSRTVRVSPLLVFTAVLVGAAIGAWLGGFFGGFVAILLAVPIAASLQVIIKEVWAETDPNAPRADVAAADAVGPRAP